MSENEESSPCVGDCKIDGPTGWCRGCLRTIREIIGWEKASEEERCAVLADLVNRHL